MEPHHWSTSRSSSIRLRLRREERRGAPRVRQFRTRGAPASSGAAVIPSLRACSAAAAAVLLAMLSACRPAAHERAAARIENAPTTYRDGVDEGIRTTDPHIALGNLAAQIAQLERLSVHGRLTVAQRAELVELIAA